MSEQTTEERRDGADAGAVDAIAIRDEDGALDTDFIDRVSVAIGNRDTDAIRALVTDLHESDLGDVIQALPAGSREDLITLLGEILNGWP